MKARSFALILALTVAVTQSAAYTDCCCVAECAGTIEAAPVPEESCCDTEAPRACTHVEPPEDLVLEGGDAPVDPALLLGRPPSATVRSALPCTSSLSDLPFHETGPPLYLRLRALRL